MAEAVISRVDAAQQQMRKGGAPVLRRLGRRKRRTSNGKPCSDTPPDGSQRSMVTTCNGDSRQAPREALTPFAGVGAAGLVQVRGKQHAKHTARHCDNCRPLPPCQYKHYQSVGFSPLAKLSIAQHPPADCRLVGALPGEFRLVAPEMPVSCRLPRNRTQQVEHIARCPWAQIEMPMHQSAIFSSESHPCLRYRW